MTVHFYPLNKKYAACADMSAGNYVKFVLISIKKV